MSKRLEVGMKVRASEEARQQGINIAKGAKIKCCHDADELVTIEFTGKTGKRNTGRIHRDFLEEQKTVNNT